MPPRDFSSALSRLARWALRPFSGAHGAPESEPYDPFLESQDPKAMPWTGGVAGDEGSAVGSEFVDVTRETIEVTRQETLRSLERDADDTFFWREARPDAVAGMAKVFLRSRCPTAYWQSMAQANSYALWGAVAMARARAWELGEPCSCAHLGQVAFLGVGEQARALGRGPRDERWLADLARADGLPMPGIHLGKAHKQAALRALFAAAVLGLNISWPDLPARLAESDAVPDRLPALEVDLSSLAAREILVDRQQASEAWASLLASGEPRALMVPDWASWLLAPAGGASLPKFPRSLNG